MRPRHFTEEYVPVIPSINDASTLKIQRVRNVVLPQYATAGSAAFDLSIGAFLSLPDRAPTSGPSHDFGYADAIELPAGSQVWVGTGIAAQIPRGWGLMIVPRSGAGAKRGLVLAQGTAVIESDYRSEICLALLNRSKYMMRLECHQRVAQAWLLPYSSVKFRGLIEAHVDGRKPRCVPDSRLPDPARVWRATRHPTGRGQR